MTPAQKAARTRENNAEKKAKRDARHAENAPIRKAWKDVRIMIRGLGAVVRPMKMPRRWIGMTEEQQEARIVEALNRVREYVKQYEIAKIEVAEKRQASQRAKIMRRAR